MNPHETLGERPPRRDMFIYTHTPSMYHMDTYGYCVYIYIYTAYVAEGAVCA